MAIYLSNAITIARIFLSFVFTALVWYSQWLLAGLLFIVIIASDVIDGYIARRRHEDNKLGAFLDPLADKVFFILAVAVLMLKLSLPWQYFLLLTRDVLVIIGAIHLGLLAARKQTITFKATWAGKLVTTLQAVTVGVLLANHTILPMPPAVPLTLVYGTAIAGLACGIHYLYKFRQ
ncbi:CDP-alcohol phosphatidyltransferase family protein [Candidatus Woesearchaeota archaeon]|nr:CDP-alcohol phosphatidyltransferase family protein [Candidatus Woesearchaeota archaeon]